MINASVAFGQEEERVNQVISELNESSTAETSDSHTTVNYGDSVTAPNDYVAITPYDFTKNSAAPYDYIKDVQQSYMSDYVFTTFCVRFVYFNLKNGGNARHETFSKLFGAVEANNFIYSNKDKTQFVEQLLTKTSDDFIKFITTNNNSILQPNFNGPILTKKSSDTYEYTFYNGENGTDTTVFPLSMTDPRKIKGISENPEKFARINGDKMNNDENYWEFVNPDDVLLPYVKKAENIKDYGTLYGELLGTRYIGGTETFDMSKPSLVYDTTTEKEYYLFGHPYFYMQNNIGIDEERMLAKAYAFVMGINRDKSLLPITESDGHVLYITSLKRILLVGASQYRYDYINEYGNDLIVYEEDDKKYKEAAPDEIYSINSVNGRFFTLIKADGKETYLKLSDILKDWDNRKGSVENYLLNTEFAKKAKDFFVK
jgi:hypothetical protein